MVEKILFKFNWKVVYCELPPFAVDVGLLSIFIPRQAHL